MTLTFNKRIQLNVLYADFISFILYSLNIYENCVLLENNCHLKVNIIVMPLPNSKVKPQKKKSTSNYAMSYKHLHQTSTNHLASAATTATNNKVSFSIA